MLPELKYLKNNDLFKKKEGAVINLTRKYFKNMPAGRYIESNNLK
jgi:hypothetical protein